MRAISIPEQEAILTQIISLTRDETPKQQAEKRRLLIIGAVIALSHRCPPHWQINVMCGRTDRLFEAPSTEVASM